MSVDVLAPSAGESVTEIEISQWTVADESSVKKDQVIAVAETEKATLEIRSPVAGRVKILQSAGTVVSPGTPVASIDETASPSQPPPEPPPQPAVAPESPPAQTASVAVSEAPPASTPAPASEGNFPLYASPSVRKMIVEHNVDILQLVKSQSDQTSPITEKDVEVFLRSQGVSSQERVSPPGGERKTSSRKMTRLRQTIARRLVSAQHTAAILTTFNEIDMGEVIAIRNQYKELFKKKYDRGLGFMSFFVKAVCQALEEFPIVNASLEEDHIVEHDYADIGIAVATSKGLVVPVIRDAQSLSFKEIEEIIADYGKKGKEGNIPMEDLTGGTFTITNGGTFGSMLSTPILNPPQSAILGMHNIVERAVVRGGEIVVRPVMYVALSYDHRLIDGADSVRFLYRIKELIEDPARLLIGV